MSAQDQRPRYYEGQYLGAADLEAAIDYARLQHARHLLAGHTWGIAAGLHLVERPASGGGNRVNVYIEPGYAWDGFGRPIMLVAPEPVPESKFASIEYDEALDADGRGRLVAVWLRYAERRLSPPAAGFGDCLDVDARARVQETFEIVVGARDIDDRHAAVVVAGTPLRVDPTAQRINPQGRIFYDETVPHQAFPALPATSWLVPIGYVRWLPVAGGPGHFVRRSDADPGPRDSDAIRRFRRYVGAVAEEILAADQAVRIRDRSRPPSTAFQHPAAPDPAETDPAKLPQSDLLFVEGAARIEGDARLLGGQLDMLTASGSDGNVPLRLRRTQRTATNPADGSERTLVTLEAQIGAAASADHRFAVGPVAAGAPLDEKFTVVASGNVGIGTSDPAQRLHVTGNRIRLENGAKRLDLRADGSAVDLQSETSKLYLRSSGPGSNNHIVMNHAAADGNVGIGTENPTHKLHVNAKAGLRQNALYLSGDAGWSSVSYNAHHDDANGAWLFPDPAHKAITIELDDASGNTRMEVYSNASATPGGWRSHFKVSGDTDRVTMAYNGGSVGIGTTAPAQKLHVAGNRVRLENAGKRLELRADGSAVDVQSDTHNLYIHSLGPAGRNHVFLSPHAGNGNVGVGTTAPLAKLHVAASRNQDADALDAYVAVVENTSAGANADVLAIKIGRGAATASNNLITFYAGTAIIGRIEGGTGGAVFRSGSGDFAECLDLAEASSALEEGEVVGVFDGRATRRTAGAQHVSAVTGRAIVVGNDRGPEATPHARVAFMGQVPVKVRGPVRAGDCIVASGREDGTGIAVPADRISAAQLAQLVGQAWESSDDPGVKRINTAIGVTGAAPMAALAAQLETLRRELRALRAGG